MDGGKLMRQLLHLPQEDRIVSAALTLLDTGHERLQILLMRHGLELPVAHLRIVQGRIHQHHLSKGGFGVCAAGLQHLHLLLLETLPAVQEPARGAHEHQGATPGPGPQRRGALAGRGATWLRSRLCRQQGQGRTETSPLILTQRRFGVREARRNDVRREPLAPRLPAALVVQEQ